MSGLLIIGSSQAGVQLAVSLRALGYEPPITLLGDEDHRPYQRPALSKEFLQGSVTKEALIYRNQSYWDEHRISVVRGEWIDEVTMGSGGAGVARSASGREFPFDRLALTVGASARKITVPGADLDGVLYLRNADNALELKARAPKLENVVVIGGGFIGLEAAASLHSMGKKVTVLEFGPRLVGRAVGPATSEFLLQNHLAQGIDVRLGAVTEEIVGENGKVTGVRVSGDGDTPGELLPTDLVLVGIGVIPNTHLAEQIGLEIGNGIVVDRYATASDGVTLAVGDCSNLPNPIPGSPEGDRVRFESVNHAIEQAKVAAYAVTGRQEEYGGIPWFWSNQGGMKLQIAGLSTGYDRVIDRSPDDSEKFSVLYYRGDRLIAADCINVPLDFMMVRQALNMGLNLPPDEIGDPAVPLKTFLAAAQDPISGHSATDTLVK